MNFVGSSYVYDNHFMEKKMGEASTKLGKGVKSYKILVRIPKENKPSEDLCIDGMAMLKRLLQR